MRFTGRLFSFLALIALILLMLPAIASANGAYLGQAGMHPKAQYNDDVVLEKLATQVWLRRGFAEVEDVYQFYNTGEQQEFVIGVPEDISTKASMLYGVYNFEAYVDGERLDTRTFKTSNSDIGRFSGPTNWHTNTVLIANGQRRIVVHRYWVRISPVSNKLALPIEPSSTWSGRIGEAYFSVHLMGGLSQTDLVYPAGYGSYSGRYTIAPTGFKAGRHQITWTFNNYEPRRSLEAQLFPTGDSKMILKTDATISYVEGTEKFMGTNATDSDPVTAWGVGGSAKGEWLTITFDKKRWVRELRIIPGQASLGTMYKFYNRPRGITLKFSDGTTQRFELKDELAVQYLPVEPVQTSDVKLHIDSVYAGIYHDLSFISEVEFGESKTSLKLAPSAWKIGLKQIDSLKLKPKYSMTDLITVAATGLVLLFAAIQVGIALKRVRRKRTAGRMTWRARRAAKQAEKRSARIAKAKAAKAEKREALQAKKQAKAAKKSKGSKIVLPGRGAKAKTIDTPQTSSPAFEVDALPAGEPVEAPAAERAPEPTTQPPAEQAPAPIPKPQSAPEVTPEVVTAPQPTPAPGPVVAPGPVAPRPSEPQQEAAASTPSLDQAVKREAARRLKLRRESGWQRVLKKLRGFDLKQLLSRKKK